LASTASDSFENFWLDFKAHFDTHFPLLNFKGHKKSNRANNFLTPELIEARKTKLALHKLSLSNPTPHNISNYKAHRNLYSTAVRQAKATYYEQSFADSAKNPGKHLNSNHSSITEISINGVLSSDSTAISNTFNNFFATVSSSISNSIPLTNIDPLSYCTDYPNLPQLDLAALFLAK
jgi:hypothetical protein